MFNVDEGNKVIKFTISSELRMVDHVVIESLEFLRKNNITTFSNFKLVLRELINNAIEHGNKKDVNLKVKCNVEKMGGTCFKIVVTDQGSGFDYNSLELKIPDDPQQTRNRGYALINALCDKIEFNKKGNQVTAEINITMETQFNVEDKDGWQVIKPTGNITAGIADKFRVMLLDLINTGHKQYRFDLTDVEDLDSVSLSVLICFSKMVNKQDFKGQLEITNAKKDLVNLFLMTRMDRIFNIVTN